VLLLAVSGRYGYHRDELYFLACGRHLAWGYPDQPPLVPLLARVMSAISPHSLVVLRLPSTIASGLVVVIAGLIARELGGGGTAQTIAAWSTGVGAFVLGAGHLLSTSTLYLFASSVLLLLMTRILRVGEQRLWLVVGLVAGIGVLASDLVAFLMAAIVLAMLIVGPRDTLRSPWPYLGGALALLLWSPYLVWQARHGWPQLTIARDVAHGGSGSSAPRWAILPEQLGLAGPFLTPVWIAGLVWLWRNAQARRWRCLALAWALLLVIFEVTGGKPYYLAAMLPFLLAAGSVPVAAWMHVAVRVRRRLLVTAVALCTPALLFALPVLPLSALHSSPVIKANYDLGETIGWPRMVAQIASAYSQVPGSEHAALLARNYGEAGAIDRYGPSLGLPHAYGVHNAYWLWGPPPDAARTVIAVGFTAADLAAVCASTQLATRLDPGHGVDDDENGRSVYVCERNATAWTQLWPRLKDYG
jgi:4-amino-4-deoxy-L-arabinose transferase-like glycosyltransferase